MEDNIEITKKEPKDEEFDAFTDGATVHKKYRLRAPKPKKPLLEEEPMQDIFKIPNNTRCDQMLDCPKCTKQFESKTGLLNHLRMHEAVRKFTCALCEKVFNTNEELIEHKTIHKDEDRVFLCKICKVAFTDHCDFLVHDLTHFKRKSYRCAECNMYFKPHYIKLHIETHFDRSVKCDICGKTVQGELRLKYHMKTHDSTTFRECGECGRMLKDKKDYDYHMLSHTGIKPFQCLYCGVGFKNNGQRQVHTQRVHLEDRPHQCTQCDRKFKMVMDLRLHMKTHDKEKDVECDECGKKFLYKSSLRTHKKLHTNKNVYECPQCDRKCPTRQALRTHLTYIHLNAKDFKCEACDLSFKTISAIRKHNKSKKHKRGEYGLKIKKKNES